LRTSDIGGSRIRAFLIYKIAKAGIHTAPFDVPVRSIHGGPRLSNAIEIAVDGSLIVNDTDAMLRNVLDGVGVGHLPEPIVASHVAQGRLVTLLDGWSRTKPGIFLYHPSRRQTPMPLQVFLRFVEKWRKLIPQPVA
jgi:DNA-binding transcriptional LysR family regulator